jgi:hypothetical protein
MYISKSARSWRSYAALIIGVSAVLLAMLEPTLAILLGAMAVLLFFSALRTLRPQRLPYIGAGAVATTPVTLHYDGQETAARPALPSDDPDYQLFLTADGYRLVSAQGRTVIHFGAQQPHEDAA